jgi:acetyl esterase/lipase
MTQIGQFIASHGFVVMNISYRFAPKFRYPAQIEDVKAAFTWFVNHSTQYQLNPETIGGWGYSAGGHLISQWALLESEKNKRPILKAVVAGGTPFDLAWYPFSPIITHLLDGFRDQRPKEYHEASPVNHVGPWAPAMFMYHGEKDRLVEAVQSAHMQNLLREVGVEARLHIVNFWGHLGTFLYAGAPIEEGILFLQEKLK